MVLPHSLIVFNGMELELHWVDAKPKAGLDRPWGVRDESLLRGIRVVDSLEDILQVEVSAYLMAGLMEASRLTCNEVFVLLPEAPSACQILKHCA